MSDPYLSQLWANAPAPWNTLGPGIASRIRNGILAPIERYRIPPENKSGAQLRRWAGALTAERIRRGLTTGEARRGAGLSCTTEVLRAERGTATRGERAWAKLAAFYGITLE